MVRISFGGLTFGIPPDGVLGEVKMFALSVTGAVTKATLQARGWAICDGTTPATQGVTSPTITAATPNLENKFIKSSDNETSGTTGGSLTHIHMWYYYEAQSFDSNGDAVSMVTANSAGAGTDLFDLDGNTNNLYTDQNSSTSEPPFYELVFFIKVRV